jgi:hypothetical protein
VFYRLDRPPPEFDYAGNCIRLVGGKLAFGHGPGHSPERTGNIGGCLDRRKVKFNRTPFANRDKPFNAQSHCARVTVFRSLDHGFHDVVDIILHGFFTQHGDAGAGSGRFAARVSTLTFLERPSPLILQPYLINPA